MRLPIEKNPVKRAWIKFWYNSVTRFLVVLLPSYFIILVPALRYLGVPGETQRTIVTLVYLAVIGWAMMDNDYTQLQRIGRDHDGKPLKPEPSAELMT